MEIFRLRRLAAPPSKKNRSRIIRIGGRPAISTNPQAKAAERIYHQQALAITGNEIWWPSEDVAVTIEFDPRRDECTVEVIPVRPRPKGFTGRKRDLGNLPEVILDALQGAVYSNDNQVSRLQVYRNLD